MYCGFNNMAKWCVLFSFFGFSCQSQVGSKTFDVLLKTMLKESVPFITVEELDRAGTEKYLLLDAREKEEYLVSHLKNAKWIGFETFEKRSLTNVSKNTPIVVYCSIGVRSEKVGEKLKALGYTNVQNLYGSIFEWVNQGKKVYDTTGKETRKVHAYDKKWGVWLNKGEKVYHVK